MRHRASRPVLDLWRRLPRTAARSFAELVGRTTARALIALSLVIGVVTGACVTVASTFGGSSPQDAPTALGQRSGPPVSRDGERPELLHESPRTADRKPHGSRETGRSSSRAERSPAPQATDHAPVAPSIGPTLSAAPGGRASSSRTTPDAPSSSPDRSGASSSPSPEDLDPPDTRVSGEYPAGDTAVLAFSANEPASFACSLDDAAYTACGSPMRYSDLAPGQHTFAVRATDDAGNADPSPAEIHWVADRGR